LAGTEEADGGLRSALEEAGMDLRLHVEKIQLEAGQQGGGAPLHTPHR
jgi:hypothetical protein